MSIRLTPPPERKFPAGRLLQRKEQLVSQIHAEHQRPATRRPVVRRRGVPVTIGATAAVAAAAIAVVVSLAGNGPDPAAAAVLRHAASTAATQPATAPPAPGQFVYTKSEDRSMNTAVVEGQAINFFQRVTREAWIGPDGSGRLRETSGAPQFATSADEEAWIAAGKPKLTNGPSSDESYSKGGLSYLDLSNLPSDTGQLKSLIDNRTIEGGPAGDAETFTIIGDLLRETYAPPSVRSALFTIASQLPGVELLGTVTDHLGRSGTAVGYSSHGNTQELIFDPQTSALLGEQTLDGNGAVVDWSAYVSSGVVDSTSDTASATP
jgi:hypothetical protein